MWPSQKLDKLGNDQYKKKKLAPFRNSTTRNIKSGEARICDLKAEDKSKVGKLIQRLVDLEKAHKNEHAKEEEIRKELESQVQSLQQKNYEIVQEHNALQSKFNQVLAALQTCQQKLTCYDDQKTVESKMLTELAAIKNKMEEWQLQSLHHVPKKEENEDNKTRQNEKIGQKNVCVDEKETQTEAIIFPQKVQKSKLQNSDSCKSFDILSNDSHQFDKSSENKVKTIEDSFCDKKKIQRLLEIQSMTDNKSSKKKTTKLPKSCSLSNAIQINPFNGESKGYLERSRSAFILNNEKVDLVPPHFKKTETVELQQKNSTTNVNLKSTTDSDDETELIKYLNVYIPEMNLHNFEF
ncbi:Protein kinase domain containing protein [Reticulomyxa filosa]|uniref:Protein kinase domain containing protein n=1 Tax=Reticulomyxa filosa TaxID=46433 RepID=X6MJN7_RETFI|nr:Protein kinase domain containing protein [Reticulomyxa filosa]|eukprot:ETO14228.1 Protein kinase domain containing protein [Reticulomyxa filosa]